MSAPQNGPGLQWLGDPKVRWYGPGYCGICGSQDVISRACRYWDPDDGWLMGVLCVFCAHDVRDQGPQPEDYATHLHAKDDLPQKDKIDVLVELGDLDSAYSETSQPF